MGRYIDNGKLTQEGKELLNEAASELSDGQDTFDVWDETDEDKENRIELFDWFHGAVIKMLGSQHVATVQATALNTPIERIAAHYLQGHYSVNEVVKKLLSEVSDVIEYYIKTQDLIPDVIPSWKEGDPYPEEEFRERQKELEDFMKNLKGPKAAVTKLSAKSFPELTKLLAEASPKPVKHIRHKGHDFTVYQNPGKLLQKDKFSYTLDGETFNNEGKGFKSVQDAMTAIKDYVQKNKKGFSATAHLWAELPYPESVQDVANLLLSDQVAQILEAGDLADDGIDETDQERLRDSAIRPQEDITETIPEFFTQDEFGYHKYLPIQEAGHMIEVIDETLGGKLTFEQIWEHDSNLAARFVLRLMGHGVGPLDDEEDELWLKEHGVTPEMIDNLPHEEPMDAFDKAHELLVAWYDLHSEPPPEKPDTHEHEEPAESEPGPGPSEEDMTEEPEAPDEEVAEEPPAEEPESEEPEPEEPA